MAARAVVVGAAAAVVAIGCRGARGHDAGAPVDAAAEAAKLATFLPPSLGAFVATKPAWTTFDAPPAGAPPRIAASRAYGSPDGRSVAVTLVTGDASSERAVLSSDAEHAFGSDTPTYWRTVSVAGRRVRVAEERPAPRRSECYAQIGANHVATVDVTPPSAPGECATLTGLLDLGAIEASGGVPGPARALAR